MPKRVHMLSSEEKKFPRHIAFKRRKKMKNNCDNGWGYYSEIHVVYLLNLITFSFKEKVPIHWDSTSDEMPFNRSNFRQFLWAITLGFFADVQFGEFRMIFLRISSLFPFNLEVMLSL